MKKICIVSANCQGAYIKALLESHVGFSADFDCHYFVNYEKVLIPESLLKNCDLFIYQPLSEKWAEVSEKYFLDTVPSKCRKIRINYLTFPIYWPFQTQDKRNEVSPAYPFGQFPYGDSYILNQLHQGKSTDDVLKSIDNKNELLGAANLVHVIDEYLLKQRDIEDRRDQKLLDYIMDSFRQHKLFETFNHPSRILCVHQVNDLLIQLEYKALAENAPNLEYISTNQQPIQPAVAEALRLEFATGWEQKYNIWSQPLTAKEYFRAYTEWDVSAIGVAVEGADERVNKTPNEQKKPGGENSIKTKEIEQLLFVHIPKTAGTSLNQMLAEAVLGTAEFKHYNSTAILIKDKGRRSNPVVMGHVHFDAYKALSTQCKIFTFLRDPIDRAISSFEFMQSHPETWLGQLAQGTLTEFFENDYVVQSICELQTRLLGTEINLQKLYAELKNNRITENEYYKSITAAGLALVGEVELIRAKERVRGMFFVGFTESFSNDAAKLFEKLGLPCPEVRQSNRTPDQFRKRDKYTAQEIELLRKLNRYDIELYEYAKGLQLNQ